MLKSSKLDKSCHAFIRSSIKIVLVFLAIMLLAGTLGVDTSSLLAILSVAGLAVSLSIQDSLSNLASAVVLLTTRPFKVGDFIEVGGKSGTVRQIGVFHTQIATPDNQLVYLPNSQITSAQITNVTGNALRRIEIVVQASYDAAPDTVKEALVRAALASHSVWITNPSSPASLRPWRQRDPAMRFVSGRRARRLGRILRCAGKHHRGSSACI
ncbi:MAG: mechanosensitive ion channel family protein [Oscillospiraceae bacterium]